MSRIDDLIQELCPDGVEHVELRSTGTWYGGGTPSKSKLEYWTGGSVPWISPKDMGGRIVDSSIDMITEAAVAGSAAKLVPPTSIAMVVRSSILDHTFPTAIVPVAVALNQDMKAVVPHEGIMVEYLAHVLSSRGQDILRKASKSGGSVTSINSPQLLNYRIPVPPLEVQREIVRVLDKFSQLEAELEAELEARRAQYEHYRAEFLTFRGEVPRRRLDEVAVYVNGKAHEKLVVDGAEIPLVTARFISRNGEANRYVPLEDVLTPGRSGDVALVLSDLPNGRALARTFFVDRDDSYAINQRVARITVKDTAEMNPKFLHFVLDRNRGLLK
ncbi:MAG: restriction endonuclease subunit S, partial [Microbacterium gubbeenense]|uniref:restriction endonuclease subunit S n=1 Tax=Microbacterium gubbeenense TaxID=159896 RepID=UPI003F9A323E